MSAFKHFWHQNKSLCGEQMHPLLKRVAQKVGRKTKNKKTNKNQIRGDRSHPSRTKSQVQELETCLPRTSAEFGNAGGKKRVKQRRNHGGEAKNVASIKQEGVVMEALLQQIRSAVQFPAWQSNFPGKVVTN